MSHRVIDKISKPILKLESFGKIAFPAIAAGSFVSVDDDNTVHYMKENSSIASNSGKKISLWEFSRLYKIGQVPILDIILIYIIIYLFNSLFLHYNYKFVLLMIIPTTIIFEIITNKEFKVSLIVVIIFAISVYYLFSHTYGDDE